MEEKQIRIGILAIAFTIVVASMLGSGFFNLLDTVVGVSLLFLLKLVPDTNETKEERWALSAVHGLAWVLIVGVIIDAILYSKGNAQPGKPLYLGSIILAAIWIGVTFCKNLHLKRHINQDN